MDIQRWYILFQSYSRQKHNDVRSSWSTDIWLINWLRKIYENYVAHYIAAQKDEVTMIIHTWCNCFKVVSQIICRVSAGRDVICIYCNNVEVTLLRDREHFITRLSIINIWKATWGRSAMYVTGGSDGYRALMKINCS